MRRRYQTSDVLNEPEIAACEALSAAQRDGGAAVLKFFAQLGEEGAFHFATTNQIVPMIAHALRGHGRAGATMSDWEAIHKETFNRLTAYLRELDRVATRLAEQGIAIVALKNGGIARGIYPCPGCCPMGDLDVLVRREDFRRAHALLLQEGYHFEFRNTLEKTDFQVAEDSGGAEYWTILPGGEKLWFELQWRPVAGRWLCDDQEPSAQELLDRSVPITGTAVRLLSPEDNLLQVALHTAKHSYVRAPGFRLHLDVERIVRGQAVNWDLFMERVARLQVKTPVYFSLILPLLFFGTPIPEHVLDTLRPAMWKERLVLAWLKRAGIFNPDQRKFGRIGYIIFTMLLHDDLAGIWRSIFPKSDWMMRRYRFSSLVLLPVYHAKRLADATFRRAKS